jgi:hypothetical protein
MNQILLVAHLSGMELAPESFTKCTVVTNRLFFKVQEMIAREIT